MRKIMLITYLRFLRFFREPGLFLIMLFLPILFTYFMGNMGSGNYRISIAFVDLDQSTYSSKLIERFSDNNTYRVFQYNQKEATEQVRRYNVAAALIIPQNFEESIIEKGAPEIEIIRLKESFELITLQNELRSNLNFIHGNIKIADYTIAQLKEKKNIDDRIASIWQQAYHNALSKWFPYPPVYATLSSLSQEDFSGYNPLAHYSVGFSMFFVMYTIIFGIGEILDEKKNGTWQRLLTLPISKVEILTGNLLGTFSVGFLQIFILILLGIYAFGVNWGADLPLTLLVIGIFVLTITCFGLFLSSVVKTSAQLQAITPVVTVCTAMLGGTFWPLDIVQSKLLLSLAKLTPQYWAISTIEGIIHQGYSFQNIIFPTLILLAMASLYFLLGLKLLNWEN
ncbi:ABC-2 type transport system permease protein [Anaerosolibacter carboniphilus]|uniref:ABC-2 type transport system permease protein n=1 Tax=Anaerosolibacter carboniphilus TaxID=1417629 RepID=A0A841KU91_9FIRM|nr:ABC transporter permease [Anaerosolibacter carboniphilus]MBB6217176.1 ABC-2 type transport system permease protein [Anaerosolibacter carboniphilus]